MKKGLPILSLLLLSVTLILNGCEKESASDDPAISDKSLYEHTVYSMAKCFKDVYNQNLAGHPAGGQNMTVNGPMGGTVIITGNTSYDQTHGITTVDLVFNMTSVKYTTNSNDWLTEITMTGSITYTGSFSDSYTSLNHQSSAMQITGTVTHDGDERAIDESGPVSINLSDSDITANIFGHSVSW
ncbi:MAG TPA: hypothetical protein PK796_10525 [Bacteroidales bacterium]|nr:hypothetical protein [Bacteroidales bacterium]